MEYRNLLKGKKNQYAGCFTVHGFGINRLIYIEIRSRADGTYQIFFCNGTM